jgi:hypothetical protein
MAGYAGPNINESGLVLALDAADKNSYPGTGTTWTDLTGNGYNGTLTNSPTFSGTNGGNIVFNGTNQYVGINYNVNLNPATNVSVSVWARLTVNDANIRNPIELSASADELYFIFLRADLSPKRWGWGVRQSNDTYAETTSTATNPAINTWYNLTLVANSSTGLVSLYINGILDGSIAYNGTLKQNAAATLSVGSDPGAARRYWQGNIANAQIYNRALSATEVLQNYNVTKTRFGIGV